MRSLTALALLIAAPALARDLSPVQTHYAVIPEAGGAEVQSDWTEPNGIVRHLDFHLPAAALPQSTRRITPPPEAEVQRAGMAAAQAASREAPPQVKLTLIPLPDGIDVHASGPAGIDLSPPIQRVMAAYRAAADQAVLAAGFRFRQPGLAEPDFPRIVADYGRVLHQSAAEIGGQMARMPMRERVQLLNGFLQSIPYETLTNRGRSQMRTPAGVLADDRGDCDAKSLTFAALLATIAPDLSTALIYDEEHAFLGVTLPQQPGDAGFSVGGKTYVAVEPVGPGWYPLGQLSPKSQSILASGKAHVAVLH